MYLDAFVFFAGCYSYGQYKKGEIYGISCRRGILEKCAQNVTTMNTINGVLECVRLSIFVWICPSLAPDPLDGLY
jgi:hypothetical protein